VKKNIMWYIYGNSLREGTGVGWIVTSD